MTNGAGYQYSHDFGFGIINGGALVELAETWPTISTQHICQEKVKREYPLVSVLASFIFATKIDSSTSFPSSKQNTFLNYDTIYSIISKDDKYSTTISISKVK